MRLRHGAGFFWQNGCHNWAYMLLTAVNGLFPWDGTVMVVTEQKDVEGYTTSATRFWKMLGSPVYSNVAYV